MPEGCVLTAAGPSPDARLTLAELGRAPDAVGALIEAVGRGELRASPAMVYRLEGARLALELLAHGETDAASLVARLQGPGPL